jgi:DNA-binding NtrC family response regulator
MSFSLLAIDDDATLLASLQKVLKQNGYPADIESNPLSARERLREKSYDCILLDVRMPGINGLELLQEIISQYPGTDVIMVSGQSNIAIAVEAIKMGATDFIEKPIDPDKLLIVLNNIRHKQSLAAERDILYAELESNFRMIGQSRVFMELIDTIRLVAATNAKILITGESGTGKELVAWSLHHNSKRRGKPYIKLNCAAIPSELLESELFGHEKGAFTGATQAKTGKFAAADGGTLFLDEIGDMALPLQAKLLRALEEQEIEVVGSNRPRSVDVRVVAASNKDLPAMVENQSFRGDLYHRLNVVNISVPPLRERSDDVAPLVNFFVERYAGEYNKRIAPLSSEAMRLLMQFQWPGNIRQLRNVIEKLVIFCRDGEISKSDVSAALGLKPAKINTMASRATEQELTLRESLEQYEKVHIEEALHEHQWKIQETANALGIDRTNLFKKMKKLGIQKSSEWYI